MEMSCFRRLENRVAVVCGPTSLLGRAAALGFAAEGARVGVCGRHRELGIALQHEIESAGGEAMYVCADERVERDIAEFIGRVVTAWGRLDVAFNIAAVPDALGGEIPRRGLPYADTSWRSIAVALKYETPHLSASGGVILTGYTHMACKPEEVAAIAVRLSAEALGYPDGWCRSKPQIALTGDSR